MIDITQPLMRLMKDGVEISRHTSAVEAMERAGQEGPGTYTLVRPDATIVVDGSSAPNPEPEPEPEPDPEPEPPAPEPDPVAPPPEPPTSVPPLSSDDPWAGTEPLSLEKVGSFRIKDGWAGPSNPAYGHGAFCIRDGYVWLAGHAHHPAVGQYGPIRMGLGDIETLPIVPNSREYIPIPRRDAFPTGWSLQGLYHDGEKIFLTVHETYDADGNNRDSLSIINLDGTVDGWFETAGNARSACWIQEIPSEWQARLGGTHLSGSAANTSINLRHSNGPSLYVFDGTVEGMAIAKPLMMYPLSNPLGTPDVKQTPADKIFNVTSMCRTGFILGDDYLVVGRTSGITSGIGYKHTDSKGVRQYGSGPYNHYDWHNYYWRYRLNDIFSANNIWEPRPYKFGRLMGVGHKVDGAYYNHQDGLLYLLGYDDWRQSRGAAQPVISAFEVV